jgi:hypothetical protein
MSCVIRALVPQIQPGKQPDIPAWNVYLGALAMTRMSHGVAVPGHRRVEKVLSPDAGQRNHRGDDGSEVADCEDACTT